MRDETYELVKVINTANEHFTSDSDFSNLNYLRHLVIADGEEVNVYEDIKEDIEKFLKNVNPPQQYHELVYRIRNEWEYGDNPLDTIYLKTGWVNANDALIKMFLANRYTKTFYELAEKTTLGFSVCSDIFLFEAELKPGMDVTAAQLDEFVREYL